MLGFKINRGGGKIVKIKRLWLITIIGLHTRSINAVFGKYLKGKQKCTKMNCWSVYKLFVQTYILVTIMSHKIYFGALKILGRVSFYQLLFQN